MQAFTIHEGLVAPLDQSNVDTDAIIPKQYLKSIRKTGFGPYLFDDMRYLDAGGLDVDIGQRRENPDFVLNQDPWRGASILLTRENFGCGSSHEHAVWALENFGFRAVMTRTVSYTSTGTQRVSGEAIVAACLIKARGPCQATVCSSRSSFLFASVL